MIKNHAMSRMLHRRLMNGRNIVPLIGIIRPGEIRLCIRRIHDPNRHLPWRWRRGQVAAGGVGVLRHLRFFRLVVAPDLAEIGVDEVDAPSSLLTDLVEDGEDFVLFGSGGEAGGDGVEGAESDAGDASVFDVGYDPTELSRVAQLPRLHLLQHLGVRGR